MSSIHSKDTRPEMIVRRFLFSKGFRYRLHVKTLPGRPDIVLQRYRTVIFVNGCFWHGHEGCGHYKQPRSNVEYWKNKIERNKLRDLRDRLQLKEQGWHVITIWECQLLPKVRKDNLRGLAYTINHISLEDMKTGKGFTYKLPEEESLMAAENECEIINYQFNKQ